MCLYCDFEKVVKGLEALGMKDLAKEVHDTQTKVVERQAGCRTVPVGPLADAISSIRSTNRDPWAASMKRGR